MEKILISVSNHCWLFLIIFAVIIISIVGFVVETKKQDIDDNLKEAPIENIENEKK